MNNLTETAELQRKDILGMEELSKEEIEMILDTAESMTEILQRKIKKVPTLQGRTVMSLFYEPSTRTKGSFDLACKYMSCGTISVCKSSSSLVKGETLKDTVNNIKVMGPEAVIMRHPSPGAAHYIARSVSCSVINAGDGSHEHPTQALLDLLTIRQQKEEFEGLRVAIIGDILHSRVARSDIWALDKLGAEVTVCGPASLLPPQVEEMGCRVTTEVEDAVSGADVVNVLRVQKERQTDSYFPSLREYHKMFCIDSERLALADSNAILMHPGPMNRGIEITTEVADGPQSVILKQVPNGVAVRMALLYLLLGGRTES